MSDETDRQDLEDRVDQLESTIEKMLPSRRDALKLGGAALVGGAAMSGSASAGTQQTGTIGTDNNPVDVESEDINNADTVTTQDLVVNGTATGPFSGLKYELVDSINSTIPANSSKSLSVPDDDRQYLLNYNFLGSGNAGSTFLRFNESTVTRYKFNLLKSNSIENRTGQDKIHFIEQQGGLSHPGSYLISTFDARISMSGTGFAIPAFDRSSLLNGCMDDNIGPLNTVDVIAGPEKIDLSGEAKFELFGRI